MRVAANGIEIEITDEGLPGGPPLLLVMGLGMQLTAWPPAFVAEFVRRGFRVLRMDNRDAGLSTGFESHGVPSVAWAALRHGLHLPVHAPYGIADMAQDTVGVLDALGLDSVHLVGASMGGMIAQHVAARHAARVRSLGLVMTTSGARRLPQAELRVRMALMSRPAGRDSAAAVAHLERVMGVIGSPGLAPPADALRQRLAASVARAWRPDGVARQLLAIAADGDRSEMLRDIRVPTTIVHGEADPLIPVASAHDLHALIPGSTLHTVPGMGHDLPDPLLAPLAEILGEAARAAERAAATA